LYIQILFQNIFYILLISLIFFIFLEISFFKSRLKSQNFVFLTFGFFKHALKRPYFVSERFYPFLDMFIVSKQHRALQGISRSRLLKQPVFLISAITLPTLFAKYIYLFGSCLLNIF